MKCHSCDLQGPRHSLLEAALEVTTVFQQQIGSEPAKDWAFIDKNTGRKPEHSMVLSYMKTNDKYDNDQKLLSLGSNCSYLQITWMSWISKLGTPKEDGILWRSVEAETHTISPSGPWTSERSVVQSTSWPGHGQDLSIPSPSMESMEPNTMRTMAMDTSTS